MSKQIFAVGVFVAALASTSAAWSMDNIEADAAYERGIKEQIQAEFMQGLKALKAQADGLGMA